MSHWHLRLIPPLEPFELLALSLSHHVSTITPTQSTYCTPLTSSSQLSVRRLVTQNRRLIWPSMQTRALHAWWLPSLCRWRSHPLSTKHTYSLVNLESILSALT